MSKEVEVIFTEDRKGQFKMGQVKKVKPGFARNYLFPQHLALHLTDEHKAKITQVKKNTDIKLAKLKKEAGAIQSKVNGKKISIKAKTHDGGQLYGSVTPNDMVKEVKQAFGLEIDKFDFKMPTAIKEAGVYSISIDLHSEVELVFTLEIIAIEDKRTAKRETKKKDTEEKEVSKEELSEKKEETEETVKEETPAEQAQAEEQTTDA